MGSKYRVHLLNSDGEFRDPFFLNFLPNLRSKLQIVSKQESHPSGRYEVVAVLNGKGLRKIKEGADVSGFEDRVQELGIERDITELYLCPIE